MFYLNCMLNEKLVIFFYTMKNDFGILIFILIVLLLRYNVVKNMSIFFYI